METELKNAPHSEIQYLFVTDWNEVYKSTMDNWCSLDTNIFTNLKPTGQAQLYLNEEGNRRNKILRM